MRWRRQWSRQTGRRFSLAPVATWSARRSHRTPFFFAGRKKRQQNNQNNNAKSADKKKKRNSSHHDGPTARRSTLICQRHGTTTSTPTSTTTTTTSTGRLLVERPGDGPPSCYRVVTGFAAGIESSFDLIVMANELWPSRGTWTGGRPRARPLLTLACYLVLPSCCRP